jgi:hypothetical protein
MLYCEVLKLGNAVCQNKKCSIRRERLSEDLRERMVSFYLLPKTIPGKYLNIRRPGQVSI